MCGTSFLFIMCMLSITDYVLMKQIVGYVISTAVLCNKHCREKTNRLLFSVQRYIIIVAIVCPKINFAVICFLIFWCCLIILCVFLMCQLNILISYLTFFLHQSLENILYKCAARDQL